MTKKEVLELIDKRIETYKQRLECRQNEPWYFDESKNIERFNRNIDELEVAKEYIEMIN
jgi:hypothetical protein